MILKQVIHFEDTNSVEATWVDEEGNQVKCHSYADVQMDMLEADLGEDAAQYVDLIAVVKANIKPAEPVLVQKVEVVTMRQARLALLKSGKLADVDAAINAQQEPLKSMARIEWDYATEVHRNWPTLNWLAPSIGLTDQDIDNLFTLASTL